MIMSLVAGLLLGAPVPDASVHHVKLDHRGTSVDVRYRSTVVIDHRQIGTVAPAGGASTLRCAWTARIAVHREARHPSGSSATRAIDGARAFAGSRPGWCASNRTAIAREVARRGDELRTHMLAAAEGDHGALAAELERLHGAGTTGN